MRLMSLKTLILVLLLMVLILPNAFAGDRTVVRSRGPIASAILGPKTIVRNVGSGYGTAASVRVDVANDFGYGRGARVNREALRLDVQQGFYQPPQQTVFIQRDVPRYAPQQSQVFIQRDVYVPRQQTVFLAPSYNLGQQSTLTFRDVSGCQGTQSFQQSYGSVQRDFGNSCYRGERVTEETVTRSPDGTETRTIRRLDR